MRESIHEAIDPTALPPRIQNLLDEPRPFLTLGLGYREIAERLQPPRSDDWVSARVAEIRRAWARQLLEAGDDRDDALRARLERYAPT
jgi:hypothetical protein